MAAPNPRKFLDNVRTAHVPVLFSYFHGLAGWPLFSDQFCWLRSSLLGTIKVPWHGMLRPYGMLGEKNGLLRRQRHYCIRISLIRRLCGKIVADHEHCRFNCAQRCVTFPATKLPASLGQRGADHPVCHDVTFSVRPVIVVGALEFVVSARCISLMPRPSCHAPEMQCIWQTTGKWRGCQILND